jgi:hypothetical protein
MKKEIPIVLIMIGCFWVLSSVRNQAIAQARERPKRSLAPVGRWYTYTGPDGDFTLTFPMKPSPGEVGQGPVTLIRTVDLTMNDGAHFSVNFQDIGGDSGASANNEWGSDLEELTSAADRQDGRRVVQTHRVAKNIVETEIWQTVPETGVTMNYLRRSILRRGRVYTLGCGVVVADKKLDRSICRRFFNSMNFTGR